MVVVTVVMVVTRETIAAVLVGVVLEATRGMEVVKTLMALVVVVQEDKTLTLAPPGRMVTVVVSVYLVRDLVAHLVLLLAAAGVMHPVIQHFLVRESSVVVGRV
jgi:hypothetical protein